VPAALGHSDVLLIPDQNGFFSDNQGPAAATQLEPYLRAFLEIGGVVVVLDGAHVAGQSSVPSETYRVLDPSLLALAGAPAFQGCTEVPCNDEDPLLGGVASDVCPTGNLVGYATKEPWVALARRDGVQPDRPFVLHRWFGAEGTGPIAFEVDSLDANADLRG